MNPYAQPRSQSALEVTPSVRRPRTYVDAFAIGCGMSFIAPVCNAAYCELVFGSPLLTTFFEMVVAMLPTALVCVVGGLGVSFLVPQHLTRRLSSSQLLIPVAVNSTLFSIYFGLLGFGYMTGSISILGFMLTSYVLAPAMAAGIGTLMHIIVRPRLARNKSAIADAQGL